MTVSPRFHNWPHGRSWYLHYLLLLPSLYSLCLQEAPLLVMVLHLGE